MKEPVLIIEQTPEIATLFDPKQKSERSTYYNEVIRSIVRRLLPVDLFFSDEFDEVDKLQCIQLLKESLPILKWEGYPQDPYTVSINMMCRYRFNAGQFFLDMISKWLIPGHRLNVSSFFAADFRLPHVHDELYTCSEILLSVDRKKDVELVRRNLAIIQNEIKLGVLSFFHAGRILEIKGLSADEKTALIQERISKLVQQRPNHFDFDLFSEMQYFLVRCPNEFKLMREFRHMSRIIYIFYLFRKEIHNLVERSSHERHISFKITRPLIHTPLGTKRVLGLIIALNLFKENEVFEEKHLIRALKSFCPSIKVVPDSFFASEAREDRIYTLYIEIEKIEGGSFTSENIRKLRTQFPGVIRNHIECLIPPVFMPRNEEEVMRNIVTLSHELRFISDIPQVMISFDEQTDRDLTFTVILLRILKPDTKPIQKLLEEADTRLKFIPDRVRTVGMLRKRHPKEATVFRVKLLNTSFLRLDHSVDLYRARQQVIKELNEIFGEVRDFNGGMIAKQIETYIALKNALGEIGERNEYLLENFFHSLFPIEMRSVLEVKPLTIFFHMVVEMCEMKRCECKRFQLKTHSEGLISCALLCCIQDLELKRTIVKQIESFSSQDLVTLRLQLNDVECIGYLYLGRELKKHIAFLDLFNLDPEDS